MSEWAVLTACPKALTDSVSVLVQLVLLLGDS